MLSTVGPGGRRAVCTDARGGYARIRGRSSKQRRLIDLCARSLGGRPLRRNSTARLAFTILLVPAGNGSPLSRHSAAEIDDAAKLLKRSLARRHESVYYFRPHGRRIGRKAVTCPLLGILVSPRASPFVLLCRPCLGPAQLWSRPFLFPVIACRRLGRRRWLPNVFRWMGPVGLCARRRSRQAGDRL